MKQGLNEFIIMHDNNLGLSRKQESICELYNGFFKDINDKEHENRVTFMSYSDTVATITCDQSVQDFTLSLPEKSHGACALVDLVSEAVISTGDRYAKADEGERSEQVIFIITAFGKDNASKRYTYRDLNEMITHQRDVYKWKFFLLTDDGETQSRLAVPWEDTVIFESEEIENFQQALTELSDKIAAFRK